jgi:hypothetical protein
MKTAASRQRINQIGASGPVARGVPPFSPPTGNSEGPARSKENNIMSRRTILSLAAAGLLTSVSAFASDYRVVTAKIPFDFRAGGTSMAAGVYEITAPQGRGTPVFVVRNADTAKAAAVVASTAVSPAQGAEGDVVKLEFLCAGAECALYRILPGGYSYGWALARPKFKDQMGRAVPPAGLRVATVVVPSRSTD